MINKILFTLTIIFITISGEICSQNSFEIHISLPDFEYVRDVFEGSENAYVAICNFDYDNYMPTENTLFLKFSDSNNISSYSIQKQDTITYVTSGFMKGNGNYFLIGFVRDTLSPNPETKLYACEVTDNFTMVWEKMFDIPSQHKKIRVNNYKIGDNDIITIEGHFVPIEEDETDPYLFFVKLTMNGVMISNNYYSKYQSIEAGEDLIIKSDENGYFLFGPVKDSLGWSFDWLSIDTGLIIIDRGGFYGTWNFFSTPLTVRKLSNNNLLYVSSNGGSFYYDVIDARLSDMNIDFLKDTMLIRQDTNMYPGMYDGMDFVDENEIFIVGNTLEFMFLPGTTDYKIYILDSDLHFKGAKIFGGDTRYAIYDILATSDGGCIVAGAVPNFEGSYDYDIYIRKIMAEDIITYTEETPDLNDCDVSVTPNPFSNEILIHTLRNGLKFQLYNLYGKMVLQTSILTGKLNCINSESLSSGTYIFKIYTTSENKPIQTGKLIKE